MTNDILVDATEAQYFCNPVEDDYRAFIVWLVDSGVLVVTQNLVTKFCASSGSAFSSTSIWAVLDHLTRAGRVHKIGKKELAAFALPAATRRRLRSNFEDHDSIKAVMLSERKLAISHDAAFCHDVNNFPRYTAHAGNRPSDVDYL